jgi:hypothetical protein
LSIGYGELTALYAAHIKQLPILNISGKSNSDAASSKDLYLSSTNLRHALLYSIKTHGINGARCAALRLVLQDCLGVGGVHRVHKPEIEHYGSKAEKKDFCAYGMELEEQMRALCMDK